jgi:Sulfatase
VRGLHLGVLYALAVSQPLLNLLGNNADFFASRQFGSAKLLTFALIVGLAIPLVLYAVDTVAGLINDDVGWVVHLVLTFGLALLLTAQLSRKVFEPSAAAIALAAVLAGLLTLIYARSEQLRSIVSLFSPLPLLVLALFLFNTPAHKLVFSGDTAAANVTVKGHVPVVFVAFDEFTGTSLLGPDNKIDSELFPNFAALTKDGTYYRNYTAAADETTRVVAGLMTGSMWHEHALPIAAEYPHNLFTLFGKPYRLTVREEATDLCPVKLCHQTGAAISSVLSDAALVYLHQISPKPLERKLTPVNETLGKFDDSDDSPRSHSKSTILRELGGGGRPARFDKWVQAIDGKVDRTLYFKHVLLPHVPWQYLPSGQTYRTHAREYIPGINGPPSFGDDWLLQQGYQRHVMQVGLVDKMIGQLVERLKQVGVYDKALIVITADNGESFLHANHDRHVADATTFTDIASTPLLIKLPNSHKGGYEDRHVRTFDIVPTVADAAGITMPWKVDGQSVLEHGAPGPVEVHREQGRKGRVFRTSLANYERARQAALRAKTELFSHGLYGIGPRPGLIGKTVARVGGTLVPAKATLDPELRKALQAVDPNGTFVPANLAGRVDDLPAGTPLAIALNGKVAAVGWSAGLKGDNSVYFSFFAPPEAFKTGANTARIYRIRH